MIIRSAARHQPTWQCPVVVTCDGGEHRSKSPPQVSAPWSRWPWELPDEDGIKLTRKGPRIIPLQMVGAPWWNWKNRHEIGKTDLNFYRIKFKKKRKVKTDFLQSRNAAAFFPKVCTYHLWRLLGPICLPQHRDKHQSFWHGQFSESCTGCFCLCLFLE